MTDNGRTDVIGVVNSSQAVVDAIPEYEIRMPTEQNTYTTKSGVTFKLKRVPPLLLADAQRNIIEPRPPKVANLDKDDTGELEEENPSDPDYIDAMNRYRQLQSDLASGIYFTRGTEPVLPLPDGVPGWEDSEWSADIEDIAGVKVPAVGRRRYFCWIKYIVLDNIDDFGDLLRAVMRQSGITMEADVAAATESFRSDEARDVTEGLQPEEGSGLGDTNQLPAPVGSAGD